MKILLNNPKVVPAVAAKEFPHLMVTSLTVSLGSLTQGNYTALVVPANFTIGEIDHTDPTLIEGDLIAELAENPAIQEAWDKVVEAIGNKLSSIATVTA